MEQYNKIISWFLPFVLIFVSISAVIELEMQAPSFVDIGQYFNVSEEIVGSTISINVIGFCVAAFFYGPLAEIFGRKKTILLGNIIMSLGAILCVFSQSISFLLFSRFLQGIGAASSVVLVPLIISDVYNTDKASKFYNLLIGIMTTFTAIAPVFGGFINHAIGWRGNYATTAIVAILGTILLFTIKETKTTTGNNFNLKSTIDDYKSVLSSISFLNASFATNFLYGAYIAFVAYAPFLYINSFKLSEIHYSIHQGIIVCMSAISNLLMARINRNPKVTKRLLYIGSLLILFSSLGLIFAHNQYTTTLFMGIFVFGNAIIFPIIFSHSMEILPTKKGAMSSINIGLRSIIFAIMVYIATTIYDGTATKIGSMLLFIAISVIIMTRYLVSIGLFDKKT